MDAYSRYLLHPTYADDVRWHVDKHHERSVPQEVLYAHWGSNHAFHLLEHLSVCYGIVPVPLAPFVADCVKRNRNYWSFLQPGVLFAEPGLAAWVYRDLGRLEVDVEVLHVLLSLSTSDQSYQYAHHVRQYIVNAFVSRDTTIIDVSSSSCICKLCAHYLDDAHKRRLCTRTLSSMLTDCGGETRAHALFLVTYLPQCMHAAVMDALVWCAVYDGNAKAMYFLQTLSGSRVYAKQLAEVLQRFPHHSYVDRLHLPVLWRMVPYLCRNRANISLMRLYESNSRASVKAGVLTGLVASNIGVTPPLDCIPSDSPCSVHDAVHYMLARHKVPPNRFLVDAALKNSISALALQVLSTTTAHLKKQMCCAKKWNRRRLVFLALKYAHLPLFARLRNTQFAWRIVFSFL